LLCLNELKRLTIGNIPNIFRAIKEMFQIISEIILLILIIAVFPISIPIMVILNKIDIKKNNPKIDYKAYIDNHTKII